MDSLRQAGEAQAGHYGILVGRQGLTEAGRRSTGRASWHVKWPDVAKAARHGILVGRQAGRSLRQEGETGMTGA